MRPVRFETLVDGFEVYRTRGWKIIVICLCLLEICVYARTVDPLHVAVGEDSVSTGRAMVVV